MGFFLRKNFTKGTTEVVCACNFVTMFVNLFICQQNYMKMVSADVTKLSGQTDTRSEIVPLNSPGGSSCNGAWSEICCVCRHLLQFEPELKPSDGVIVFIERLQAYITKYSWIVFCRAMLCISAAHAVVRCQSVRSSITTFVDSVETNKHIFNFSPSGSHSILVFLYQTLWQYSDGDPLTGTSNAGAVKRNRDSRPISGYRIDDCWTCEQ